MYGVTWHSRKPPNPVEGDCCLDPVTGDGYIWVGGSWAIFAGAAHDPSVPFKPPTEEQLEKYPSLKKSWEEFLVIKKILGV